MRRTVGNVRLEGAQAYLSLHEVYRVIRLMVNGFQPSVKLQEKRCQEDHVRCVYDVAQTPLQRLLASGLLSDSRQQEVREWFEHLDPLALSERLDEVLQTLWSSPSLLPLGKVEELTDPERETTELLQEEQCLPTITSSPEESLLEDLGEEGQPGSSRETPTQRTQQFERLQTPLEVAILTFVQELSVTGRRPATLAWHKSSLMSLERFLRKQSAVPEVRHVSQEILQAWLAELRTTPSVFTRKALSMRSIATAARSARAFCNWLVRQGQLQTSPFPPGGVPQTADGEPRLVESRSFIRLLEACRSCKQESQRDQGMDVRNRAILWLLLETGLSVSDLCRLRLSEVDIHTGVVTVRGTGRVRRIFPLSVTGKEVVRAYVKQVRMTLAWTPGRSEDQEILLLSTNRTPLTTNTVTPVFARLNQRAGLERKPICPSMLRETYAIRFLQAGGRLAVLQEQLGVRDSASVKRYERFSHERDVKGAKK